MISVIITSYKEPTTIGKAIEAITSQEINNYELLVVAPDDETLDVAREHAKKNTAIKPVKDAGKGKPAALNLAVSKAKGEIIILTDGDVYLGKNSIKCLVEKFKDESVGAASGRPVSINSRNNKYGFWAYILTEIAHERRLRALQTRRRFFCSGYLFAIRKKLFPNLSEDLLSEDGFISHKVYKSGHIIAYCPDSVVYVKYPTNFSDWIIQKKRSAGGYNQIRKITGTEIRSFKKESFGVLQLFKYVSNLSEVIWLFELFIARAYLWFVIYRDINLKKKSHKEIWRRVSSTK
jgi:cellulose synthase/poly-beta-1,6-N-acetylglucosamine synthase-like glycosyltransferase